MAQVYTSGPCHMFAGVLPNKKPVYLGTAEKAPLLADNYLYDPVFNDIAGQGSPLDKTWQGMTSQVSFVLTRFNYSVVHQIGAGPNFLSGLPGVGVPSHLGHPVGQSGATFPFWILFPYAANPAYPGMPGGHRFWSCTIVMRQIMPGTTAKRIQVVLEADRAFPANSRSPVGQAAVAANAAPVAMITYDFNMSEVVNAKIN